MTTLCLPCSACALRVLGVGLVGARCPRGEAGGPSAEPARGLVGPRKVCAPFLEVDPVLLRDISFACAGPSSLRTPRQAGEDSWST